MSYNHHGLFEDCEIKLIDKTDLFDLTRREFFWMRKLKTLGPMGVNVLEDICKTQRRFYSAAM